MQHPSGLPLLCLCVDSITGFDQRHHFWRCIFPQGELRLSAFLQAAIIALIAGSLLRKVPAGAPMKWWPFVAFGYAFLAGTVVGLFWSSDPDDFHPASSLFYGVIFAVPFWGAAVWLAHTPYRLISMGCWVMVALWALHFLLSVAFTLRRAVLNRSNV
jgi:hypothetical protein